MLNKIINYLKESRFELIKVTWPKRDEVFKLTGVVLVVSLATAAYLSILDSIFAKLTQIIIESKK